MNVCGILYRIRLQYDDQMAPLTPVLPLPLQHPLVVAKVHEYLNALSSGGSGWSTWRMKLPPSILAQMAQIIQRASGSGIPPPFSTSAATDNAEPSSAAPDEAASGAVRRRPLPGHIEDLMSSEELIEKFGLQSLMDGAAGQAAAKEKRVQLLAATLHPEDGKKLQLAAGVWLFDCLVRWVVQQTVGCWVGQG